jgi:hypothetical protein
MAHDNFARRDLIRHRFRQYAYPAHLTPALPRAL